MTASLDPAGVRLLLQAVSTRIIDQVDVLTEADLAIGDGDHGVGMRRGFEAAAEALAAQPDGSVDGLMKAVGMAVMSKTGGAAGAVFGTLFRSGGKALEGRDRLDADGFALFLETGLEAVMKRGGVSAGQKTMVDALAPAAAAAAAHRTSSLSEAVAAATRGARNPPAAWSPPPARPGRWASAASAMSTPEPSP
jgi:dihydroxyacetone kinase-like protein